MTKINITTLGCPKNVVDSGHLTRRFESEGFVHVDDPNNADIILVNTCGFIRDAKEESIEEILKLAKIKRGQGSKVKSKKKLVVFGCLAKRYRDELMKEIPEMDAIFGVGEDSSIIEYCKGLAVASSQLPVASSQLPAASYAYLKIAEGCDKKMHFLRYPFYQGTIQKQSA